jgi:hypothetical protein
MSTLYCESVCCLEFTFLEQSAQWSVPIVRMKMNENKPHVLLLSMNQRSKKCTRFCNGIYKNSMYCNRLIAPSPLHKKKKKTIASTFLVKSYN